MVDFLQSRRNFRSKIYEKMLQLQTNHIHSSVKYSKFNWFLLLNELITSKIHCLQSFWLLFDGLFLFTNFRTYRHAGCVLITDMTGRLTSATKLKHRHLAKRTAVTRLPTIPQCDPFSTGSQKATGKVKYWSLDILIYHNNPITYEEVVFIPIDFKALKNCTQKNKPIEKLDPYEIIQ